MCVLPLIHPPQRGPGPQPRHVPWLGIEAASLWFMGWCSIHWATPARAPHRTFLQAQVPQQPKMVEDHLVKGSAWPFYLLLDIFSQDLLGKQPTFRRQKGYQTLPRVRTSKCPWDQQFQWGEGKTTSLAQMIFSSYTKLTWAKGREAIPTKCEWYSHLAA